jgi:signal transduction histidine kinase
MHHVIRDDILARLQSHRTLAKAPRHELAWMAERATLVQLDQAYVDANQAEGALALWVVLSGHFSIRVDRGTGPRKVLEWRGGDVAGLLPYSRMVTPPGRVVVHEPGEFVRLDREHFRELIRECHDVTSILVHTMLDRARQFTVSDFHAEKMVSLGRLAAGLAHELNNPASAVMRGAKALTVALDELEGAERALGMACLPSAALQEIDRVRATHWTDSAQPPRSAIERADREDALEDWLAARGVSLPDVGPLARSSIDVDTLSGLAGSVGGPALGVALRSLVASRAARQLAWEVETAAARIHALVSAVKGFTHLEQAPVMAPVALERGLKDTMAVLNSKARAKSIELNLQIAPDLPVVTGVGNELNQVWANLLDNALDAAPERGHVNIVVDRAGETVVVRFIDDGPGIPKDLQHQVFDQFFTTKPIGQGTGLGLDISRRLVRRHDGQIEFETQPGRTEFRVTLPAKPTP